MHEFLLKCTELAFFVGSQGLTYFRLRSKHFSNTVQTSHRQECLCHKNKGKKLRYMSKIAAISPRTDNTQLSCTQPVANLLMACW